MPGTVRSISEGSAQMQEFTFDPAIVRPIEAAGDRAVPKLVECIDDYRLSQVTGLDGHLLPVGAVCALVLKGTAFFQERLTSNRLPPYFNSKTDVEYAPAEGALWEAQQLWREYLRAEMPN